MAREKRAKEQAKAKLRDEVRRLLIDKGAVGDVLRTELLDVHGCYEKTTKFTGALGG